MLFLLLFFFLLAKNKRWDIKKTEFFLLSFLNLTSGNLRHLFINSFLFAYIFLITCYMTVLHAAKSSSNIRMFHAHKANILVWKCRNTSQIYITLTKEYHRGTYATYSRWAIYSLSYINHTLSCEGYTICYYHYTTCIGLRTIKNSSFFNVYFMYFKIKKTNHFPYFKYLQPLKLLRDCSFSCCLTVFSQFLIFYTHFITVNTEFFISTGSTIWTRIIKKQWLVIKKKCNK